MLITELFLLLKQLSRTDKLRVIRFLSAELAKEEEVPKLQTGAIYSIWSPQNCHAAAHTLEQLLESD